jgi:hypothetical protein
MNILLKIYRFSYLPMSREISDQDGLLRSTTVDSCGFLDSGDPAVFWTLEGATLLVQPSGLYIVTD